MKTGALSVLLEKAARDAGFDQGPLPAGEPGWLAFRSGRAPVVVWVGATPDGVCLAALSRMDVASALGALGERWTGPWPADARAVLAVANADALRALLRRAWGLARSLPPAPLEAFAKELAIRQAAPDWPASGTEAERLVMQRIGQDKFRAGLEEFWGGRCAITGLAVRALLRASHAKPWSKCDSDAERLDVHNGLLLTAHLDAAFDAGLITVTSDGQVKVSARLDSSAQTLLGLDVPRRVEGLRPEHRAYLEWHRSKEFRQ